MFGESIYLHKEKQTGLRIVFRCMSHFLKEKEKQIRLGWAEATLFLNNSIFHGRELLSSVLTRERQTFLLPTYNLKVEQKNLK